jgi:hypothetical protein
MAAHHRDRKIHLRKPLTFLRHRHRWSSVNLQWAEIIWRSKDPTKSDFNRSNQAQDVARFTVAVEVEPP